MAPRVVKGKSSIGRSLLGFLLLLATSSTLYLSSRLFSFQDRGVVVPLDAESLLAKCRSLHVKPGPHVDFHSRARSDRYQPGTKAVYIRNATIWSGDSNGKEVLHGDVFLDDGLIKATGDVPNELLANIGDVVVVDAQGAWLTPGIVDLHSHLGGSTPALRGSDDDNSYNGPITPWLRRLDGLNTHDLGYESSISGGVTTSLVLPGSLNAIGGQGLVMKLRPTKERSPTSMLLDPYLGFNGTDHSPEAARHWGHMKHACGENPKYYRDTRMDSVWLTRQAYDTARSIKVAQDDYCEKALSGDWSSLRSRQFPDSLQWQPLIDVLRGKIKVQTHCYEATDIDNFVRLSNEFQFEVAAFHHAHEAWLIPDVLRRAYGKKPPALAIFSTFARYKREAYLHSEFAPRVLADEGFDVVMKSDHSAIPSRNLLAEAAMAHYWGLPENIALASVISTPARILGLDHRIGFIREGYDADVVLWDSHPLSLGATPTQVIIDGILQISHPHTVVKPASHQQAPSAPNWDRETAQALEYNGLPPLEPRHRDQSVIFTNVSHFWSPTAESVIDLLAESAGANSQPSGIVVVQGGRVVCFGRNSSCDVYHSLPDAETISLQGGAIQPALVAYGTGLGLTEIAYEASTSDGYITDPLDSQPPLFGPGGYIAKAVDGLQFGTRDALLAYRAGVTVSVTSPSHQSWLSGLSTAFSLGAPHKLDRGAVVSDVVAVHVSLSHGDSEPSVSTKIGALRRLLTQEVKGDVGEWFQKVANGSLPLIINVGSADIIATLVSLKKEVETKTGTPFTLTIAGATEAHLVADELAEARIGVIVTPTRSYPYTWDERRTLPGPPMSADSLIGYLVKRGITVGVGPRGIGALGHPGVPEMANSRARNLRFDIGEAMLDSGVLSKEAALALATVNLEKLLGLDYHGQQHDLVATANGGLLGYEGKVLAVISPRRELVDVFSTDDVVAPVK
ncbi:hypothetical protein DICSQDRAFT_132576 [Dichomitus squalens LYAD-421 SS1]|uniref:uncharacterized protein n=1 Tax=Dichomitus squalens (strain LYAD-421) TaxID=732165 RepID=UPI0004412061|nr:uncharacterized protein DICSQDRAFT_132576 [Dichomitus squalens LYAD-421 SS1]EJF65056.1 hypothetical protein DICSQDRAFT_132576 [Dichomitus squalens LYAD-421 SS1]